jgi:hypothetical protein
MSTSPSSAGLRRDSATAAPRRDLWLYVFAIAAIGNLANGAWMLADPAGWYAGIPAAVPDFGPLNEHFVRDLGSVFTVLGIALAWGAVVPAVRFPMLAIVTLFYVLHALVHVLDTVRGLVGPAHWAIDFPAVYFPAVLLAVLTAAVARSAPNAGR